jgi:hypothetical protein
LPRNRRRGRFHRLWLEIRLLPVGGCKEHHGGLARIFTGVDARAKARAYLRSMMVKSKAQRLFSSPASRSTDGG